MKKRDKDSEFWVSLILAVIGAFVCLFSNNWQVIYYSAWATFVLCAFCAGYCISFMKAEKNKWYLIPIFLLFAGAGVHIWITEM